MAVGALGASAVTTQLVLMRELLAVLAGNEMVFGVVLGDWLLLTGLGAFAGRWAGRLKRPETALIAALLASGVLPILTVLAVRTLPGEFFLRGAMVGLAQTVIACFLALLPYCLTSGFLLTAACAVLAGPRRNAAGEPVPTDESPPPAGPAAIAQVYVMDGVGTAVGGLAFSFLMVNLLNHFGCLYVTALATVAAAGALAVANRRPAMAACAGILAIALAATAAFGNLDERTVAMANPGFRVAFHGQSPYGRLVVTERAGQYNFIENGVPRFSTGDAASVEETVHLAMSQRPTAKRVLLIGGGVSGTAREILKYNPLRVDYVELDPLILRVGRRFVPSSLDDPRINVIEGDGRSFVAAAGRRGAADRYDVIIADVPDPYTSQANRYYTLEFFRQVKGVLADGGVFCLPLGHYDNYLSDDLWRMIATAGRTLKMTFGHVLVLPAGRLFLLASDGPLTADVAGGMARAGVKADYVTGGYLFGTLTPSRLADVAQAREQTAPVNTDFDPVLYFYHLRFWMARFQTATGSLLIAALAALAAYMIWFRRVTFAIFATGFAASSLEVVILLGFQILYGSVYHELARLVTMFMIGLAGGAIAVRAVPASSARRAMAALEFATAAFACALGPAMMGLGRLEAAGLPDWAGQAAFSALTAVLGALVGGQFPLAGESDFDGCSPTAGRLYLADMVGSCLGAMAVSAALIPLIGVTAVCLLTAALSVSGGLAAWPSRRGSGR